MIYLIGNLWFDRLGRPSKVTALAHIGGPVAALLLLGAGMLGYYDWRVTGDPLRVPCSVNQQTYGWPLTLPWFPVRTLPHKDPMFAALSCTKTASWSPQSRTGGITPSMPYRCGASSSG